MPVLCWTAAGGWAGIESLLQQLPGQHYELTQACDDQGLPLERRQAGGKAAAEAATAAAASGRRRKVLVMFVGGVTCAEVGARRVLCCTVVVSILLRCAMVVFCPSLHLSISPMQPPSRPVTVPRGVCVAGLSPALPQPEGHLQLRLPHCHHCNVHWQQPAQWPVGSGCGGAGGRGLSLVGLW